MNAALQTPPPSAATSATRHNKAYAGAPNRPNSQVQHPNAGAQHPNAGAMQMNEVNIQSNPFPFVWFSCVCKDSTATGTSSYPPRRPQLS
jgi:hypothetical protein